MLGLIKKDLLLVKANLKTLVVIFAVFIVMMFQGQMNITFVMPLIGIMLFISTFSYDDFNNWNAYAVTLPNGRKNVVKAKYITSIIITIILSIISILVSLIISYISTQSINIPEVFSPLIGTTLSTVIIMSLLYPLIFKVGSTNGRIWMFAIVFGFMALIGILSRFIDLSAFKNAINDLEKYWYIVLPLFVLVILGISYIISNKIYKNKEF